MKICKVDGCQKPKHGRGMCPMHYQRVRVHGDPHYVTPRKKKLCSVDGCDRKHYGRGWCEMHYQRVMAHGEPGPADPLVRSYDGDPCAVNECNRDARSRGWCQLHYQRWRTHGDPLQAQGAEKGDPAGPLRVKDGKRERYDGYVDIWDPDHPLARNDGYVFEHRMVAYDAGLLSGPDDDRHIHHVNGDKADNRPENLLPVDAASHQRDYHGSRGPLS